MRLLWKEGGRARESTTRDRFIVCGLKWANSGYCMPPAEPPQDKTFSPGLVAWKYVGKGPAVLYGGDTWKLKCPALQSFWGVHMG